MTFSVTEWPKIVMESTKQGPQGNPGPLCRYQTTIPLTHFSCFCIQKCPSNGSINIEILIKILNLKSKQVGSELAACSVLGCFGVQIGSSYSLLGGSRGANPDPEALTDDTGRWCPLLTSAGCTHRQTFQGHLILLAATGNRTQANIQERCEERACGAHQHSIHWLFCLPRFFLSFQCVPLLPQICIQVSPDFLPFTP